MLPVDEITTAANKILRIPYERALDFANKEKITEILYPLFVHNIGALLYHPSNQSRTTQVMVAAERRKQEQASMRNGQAPPGGLPSIQHHSPMGLAGPQPPLPSFQGSIGRPPLERAASFPTPPTSASSSMASMGVSESFSYPSLPQSAPPMSIDTSLSNARSMPNTPATTPPGNSIQSMQQPYSQTPVSQPYDSSRQVYSAPAPHQPSCQHSTNGSYPHPASSAYVKNEMGPPASRPTPSEQADKQPNGLGPQPSESAPHASNEEEGEHDSQDAEYTHGRPPYNYSTPAVGSISSEHNLAPELANSPSHQAGSGRATPRTTTTGQGYYPQSGGGYASPPSVQQSSSNFYSVISDDRPISGSTASAPYPPHGDMQNGYSSHSLALNGGSGAKRGRDDEDDGGMDVKRRKTLPLSEAIPSQYPPSAAAPPVGGALRRR